MLDAQRHCSWCGVAAAAVAASLLLLVLSRRRFGCTVVSVAAANTLHEYRNRSVKRSTPTSSSLLVLCPSTRRQRQLRPSPRTCGSMRTIL